MSAGRYNMVVEKGATFSLVLTWKDANSALINLTGYTARLQFRDRTKTILIAELTTANGGITLGGAAGTITLAMTAAATTAITHSAGVYDLEMIAGSGAVTRLIEGGVQFTSEVTV